MTRDEADRITTEAGEKLQAARKALGEAAMKQNDIEVALAVKVWQSALRNYKRTWRKAVEAYNN